MRTTAVTTTATDSSADPTNTSRNGALAGASAFIPRIAVIAATGPVRSRPRMTIVENA